MLEAAHASSGFLVTVLVLTAAPLAARADEPEPTPMLPDVAPAPIVREPQRNDRAVMPAPPPRRRRRDRTLFSVGLATAITGGVALATGTSLMLLGDFENRDRRGRGPGHVSRRV